MAQSSEGHTQEARVNPAPVRVYCLCEGPEEKGRLVEMDSIIDNLVQETS